MARHIELNPITHLTIGTVGPPGRRTFYLQGGRETEFISLTIEKEQAIMLTNSFESLIEELEEKYPGKIREAQDPVFRDMRLREPIESLFRVGNLGLGYNEESDQIVMVAYELVDEGVEPNVVSFWTSRDQAVTLIKHTNEIVKAGRPICGNCGAPIDPDGHFCPQRNGHTH